MSYTPTAAERQELADIQAYLKGHAQAGTLDRIPEGSVAAVLNRASPNVREHIARNREMVEHVLQGGRSEPFQPPLTIDPSRVPPHVEAIAAKARTEDVTHGLLSRMNTDQSSVVDAPPTTRDYLEAAFDAHTPQE